MNSEQFDMPLYTGSLKDMDDCSFVDAVYLRCLGRYASGQDLYNNVNALWSGSLSRRDILDNVIKSSEASEWRKSRSNCKPRSIAPEELLCLDGADFLDNAYFLLTGNHIGTKKAAQLLELLELKLTNKQMIIDILCCSKEAICYGSIIEPVSVSCQPEEKNLPSRMQELFVYLDRRMNDIKQNADALSNRLQEMDGRLLTVESNTRSNNAVIAQINQQLQQNADALSNRLQEIDGRLLTVESNTRSNNAVIAQINQQLQQVKQEFTMQLCNALSQRVEAAQTPGQIVAKTAEIHTDDAYSAIDYFDFENHFRGSLEHVKNVQKVYLPYFEGCSNVLDLGCGRSEFTELLMENNISVRGVDLYAPYVTYAKMRGLPVEQGDLFLFLAEQETADGIFLGQVVEHLTIEQITQLLHLAHDKLEDGKYLIMETPNPMTLAIFTHAFYIDPSHQKPIHPLTLQYLAQKAGFQSVEIFFPESSKLNETIPALKPNDQEYSAFNTAMSHVADLLFGPQDYAIIARK